MIRSHSENNNGDFSHRDYNEHSNLRNERAEQHETNSLRRIQKLTDEAKLQNLQRSKRMALSHFHEQMWTIGI